MRMIPPYASDLTKSDAEKGLFRRLKLLDLGGAWTALHSLNVADHNRRAWGELDFLLVGPVGVFAIEVKGGRVSQQNGIWTYTDRNGKHHRDARGPFNQVRDTLFSLRDTLRDQIPEMRGATFGFCVAFPDSSFDRSSVEWDPSLILDGDDLNEKPGLKGWIAGMVAYWQRNQSKSMLSPQLLATTLDALRPDFEIVPSLRHLSFTLAAEQVRLSTEQFVVLDQWEGNPRLRCLGGAGTGKTLLAIEAARRADSEGETVLLVCSNPTLAAYLRSTMEGTSVVAVTLDELNPELHRSSYLVVDEGQDLLTIDCLDRLERVLEGGLADGRWLWLMDPNNQAGLERDVDPQALEFVESFSPVTRLTHNFRNTAQILRSVRALAGAQLERPMDTAGPETVIEFTRDVRKEGRLLTNHINRLLGEHIDPVEITILMFRGLNGPLEVDRSLQDRLEIIDADTIGSPVPGRIGIADVADFKGLENLHVALVGVDDVSEESAARLYVACTRARTSLWVGCRSELEREVTELVRGALG